MSRIDDPASAVAASLCVIARSVLVTVPVTNRHPSACGWCDYPAPVLSGMVADFNYRAGYDQKHGTYARHDVRVFAALPRAEQVALVAEAQALEERP